MARTERVERIIRRFPKWGEFFFPVLPWNADKETKRTYNQAFYNMQVIRAKVDELTFGEAEDFLTYLQSTRLPGYGFIGNMANPFNPRMPPENWFSEKLAKLKDFYRKNLGENLELRIERGAAHLEKHDGGRPIIIFRPYDFTILRKQG